MKLLTRTNRQYILFSIIAYLVIAIVFYSVTEYVIYEEVEYRLKVERQDFEHYVAEQGVWEASCYFVENKIELKEVKDTLTPLVEFADTLFVSRYSDQIDPFRQYSFYTTIGDQPYEVNIRKSLIESNKLLTFITTTMLILVSFGLIILILLQRRISKKVWKPFYQSLSNLKAFEISQGAGLTMDNTDIYEFNELNEVLEKMTNKIAVDYQNLKEFTENAAHEIQTPLALITTRIEELIQGKNFTDKQMYWIEDIHKSTIRLSKLHQGLLLLSKIDNGQFYTHETVNLNELIQSKLNEYEEFTDIKELKVAFNSISDLITEINPTLADILIGNLIKNTIKHNQPSGYIKITTQKKRLEISNTGSTLEVRPEQLFERFKKHNQSSASLGLGLAIVKKICEYYNVNIRYINNADIHTITLDFPT
ncbi:HAMP domain-containing histidine kinase [Reichenbachiella carrageenanivorans]|uniref:histidine kinase n=1 Tax=Reichenbachiella carrageenanivorans TaxID=2979869 RepID=A0ABY6CX33_9BACT|nr:HAMP domain-containing sensor histidine kinase [Reichenbachiella carrageenanivorans]UXX78472.1 HAMP domain-containing histidine kinase [Reichenbachiella carrageenanivorans]